LRQIIFICKTIDTKEVIEEGYLRKYENMYG